MNKRTWRDFLKTEYSARQDLKANGVEINAVTKDANLFIPIRLDPKKVANEYPVFDECLLPIDEAINTLMKVHPLIDEIVQEALQQKKKSGA